MDEPCNYIYGKNPIEEALLSPHTSLNKIFIYKSALDDKKVKHIKELATQKGVPYILTDKANRLVNDKGKVSRESVWAMISPIKFYTIEDLSIPTQNSLVIIANNIEDPHNLGAMIRSACAVGAQAVIIPKRRSSPITSTVVKASAGTIFHTKIIQVSNLVQAIEKLKDLGFWIVGCDAGSPVSLYTVDFKMSTAFVLGNEAKGISKLVQEQCDYTINIPIIGKAESLNVSNATCIVMYEWLRQNMFSQ